MPGNETLKQYAIEVEVNTKKALDELDKLQKKVDKSVNSGAINKGLQETISEIKKEIHDLSDSVSKDTASIKNKLNSSLSGINTNTLKTKLKDVNNSINDVREKIEGLSNSFNKDSFTKFEKFIEKLAAPLGELNKTVTSLNATLTSLTEPLQTISKMKIGAIDTKAFEQSVKGLKPITDKVADNIIKEIERLSNFFKTAKIIDKDGLTRDFSGIEKMTAHQARQAISSFYETIENTRKQYSFNLNELFDDAGVVLSTETLNKIARRLDEQIAETLPSTKSRQSKKSKNNISMDVGVDLKVDTSDESIDKLVNDVSDVLNTKVQSKFKDKTSIKVSIKGDTVGLKKEIESQIKTFNNTAKTDPSLQVDVPIKAFIDENSMKMLRSRLQSEINEGDGLTLNGTTNITGIEGISTDVSAIRELLSNGIPITSIGSISGAASQTGSGTPRIQGLKGYEWIFDNQLKDAGAQKMMSINTANYELAKEAKKLYEDIIKDITNFVTGKSTKNPLELLEKNPLYSATVADGKYAKYGEGKLTNEWQSELRKIVTDTIEAIKIESGEIENSFAKLKQAVSTTPTSEGRTITTKSGTYKVHSVIKKNQNQNEEEEKIDPFTEAKQRVIDEINKQKKDATSDSQIKNWIEENAKRIEEYREEQERTKKNQIKALETELVQVQKKSEIEKKILSENDNIDKLKRSDLKQYEKVKGSTRRIEEINQQLGQLKNSPLYSTEDADKEIKALQDRLSSLQQEVDAEKQILSKNEELAKVEDLNRQLRNINERIANETSGDKEAALIKKQIETQKERDNILSKMPKDLLDKYNNVQNLINEITNISQRISSLKSNAVISDEDIAKKLIEEPFNAALNRTSASSKITKEMAEWLDLAMQRAISTVVDKYRKTDDSELYNRRMSAGNRANALQKSIGSSDDRVLGKTLEEELRVFSNKLENSNYRELVQIFSNLLDYGTSFNRAGEIVNSMADEADKANAVYQFMKQIDLQTEATLKKYENQRNVLENIKQLQADTSKDHSEEINSLMADDITKKLMTDKNGVVRSIDDAFSELDKIINIIVRNANIAKKELATTVYSSIGSERNYDYKKDRYLSEVSELQRLSGYDSSGFALTGTERDRYETLKNSVKVLREEISAYEDINNIQDRVVMTAHKRLFEEEKAKETLSEEAEISEKAKYAVYGFSKNGRDAYNETSRIGKSFYSEASTEDVTKAYLKHQIVIDDLTATLQKYEDVEKMANDETKAQIQERIKLHEQEIQKIKEKIERETERSAKSNGKYNYNPQWDNKKINDIQKDIDYLRSGTAEVNKELESKRKELDKITEEIKDFETKTMSSFGIKDSKQAEELIEYFVKVDHYLDETKDRMKDLQSQRNSLLNSSSKGKTVEQIDASRKELKEVNAEIEKLQDEYGKLHNELLQFARDNGIKLGKILGTDKFGIDKGKLNLSDDLSEYMSKVEARNKLQRRIAQLSEMYEDENGNTISYEERTRNRILDLRTKEKDLILSTLQAETKKRDLAKQEINRREQEIAEKDRILSININKERQNADKEFEKTNVQIDRQLEKERKKRDDLATRIDGINEKHKESIELARQELELREKELQTLQTKAQKFAGSTLDALVSNSNVKNPNKQSSRNKVRNNRENQLSALNEEVNQAQKLVDKAKEQLRIQEQLLEKDLNRYNLMDRLGEADQKILSLEVQQNANRENHKSRQEELEALASQQEILKNQVELEEKDLEIKKTKSKEVQDREQYRKDLDAKLTLLSLDKQIQEVEKEINNASKDNLDWLNKKLLKLQQEYVQQLNILDAQKKQKENAKEKPYAQEQEAKKIEHMATIRDANGNINKTIALGDIATETTLRQILTVVSGGKVPAPGVTGDRSKGGIQLSEEYKNTLKGLKGLKPGAELNDFLKKLFIKFPAEAFSQYRLRANKNGDLTYLNLNRKKAKATDEDHEFTAKKLAEWGITQDQLTQVTKDATEAEKKHSKSASNLSDKQEEERKAAWAAIRALKGDKGGKDISNNEALANLFKENSNYLNYYGFKENEFGKYRAIKAENLSDEDIKLMESLGISFDNIAKKAKQAAEATRDYANATEEQLKAWYNEGDVENVIVELDRRNKKTQDNAQTTRNSTQATKEETVAVDNLAQSLGFLVSLLEKAKSANADGLVGQLDVLEGLKAHGINTGILQTALPKEGEFTQDYVNIAKNEVRGFVKGIQEVTPELIAEITKFAKVPEEVVRQVLQINSPSETFKKLGFYTDQGLAVGILENADLVKNAIIDMLKQGQVSPKEVQELIGWNKDDGTLGLGKGKSVIRKNSKLYGSFQAGVQGALDTDTSLTSYLNKDNLKEVYSTFEKCLVTRRKLIEEGKESLEYDQRILEINKLLSETLVDTQKYKGIENRNILKMYGEQQTYLKQDAEGNVHTVGHFSFDEQLLDGRIQRVFVDFNEQTQEWEERLFRVETNFKKIEDRIMALDKEYAKAVNKNDQNKIDSIGLERDKYVSLLQFYSQSKEFAYDISQFEEKRKQAAKELVNIYNEQNRVEADKIRNKEQEESAKRVASLQKEQLTTWREIKDISEQMTRLNIQTSQGDKLKYDDLERQKKSLIEILNQKTRELKINDENFNIEKNRADLAAVTAEVKNKYAISDAYKMDAETAKAEATKIREEEKQRREEEKKRVASERETTREIANLTKHQIKAYEELWDVRKKIATLDPSKDANQITALRDLENARKYVFSGITSSLSALDPSGTRNRTKNLFAIGKDYNSQIDVIKGRQADIEERELLSQLNQAWKEVIVSKQRYYDLSRKDNISSNQLADEKKKADEAVKTFEKLKTQYNKTFVPSDDPLKKLYDHILKDTNDMINKFKQDLTKVNPTEFTNIITELQNLPSTLSANTPDAIQGIIDKIVELQDKLKALAGVIDSESRGKLNLGEKLFGKMDNAGFLNNKIPLFSNELNDIKTKWDNLWNNWKGTQDEKDQLDKLIERLQILNSTASQYKDTMGKMKFVDIKPGQIDDVYKLRNAMAEYAEKQGYSNVVFQKFDKNQNHLVMSAKNANGELVQLAGAFNKVNQSMYVGQPIMKQSISFWNSMSTSLKQAFSTFGYYLGFAALIRKTMQEFRQGINTLKEFDSALTTISYTMDLSQKELKDLGLSAVDMAEDLSMSMENALKVYQIYANMQTTAQEIEEVARPTAILSNLSGVDASTAADQVQGILQQFNMLKNGEEDLAETSMHVVDVLDKISANVAIDYSKGIGIISEAVTATGQVAHDAGMSFEELAAITAKVAERTREDGSTIGNAMKTMFTRISKVSKMPQYADEVDNEQISKAAKALHDIGIEVYNSNGEFNNITDTLTQLNSKWKDLTDVEQSNIAFQIAATRQSAKFKSMLEAWTGAMDLAAEATEANGNALENQEKYEESYAGKLQKLQTEWQEFWLNLLNSDGFKSAINILIKIVEWIDKLGDSIGHLTVIIGGLGLGLLLSTAAKIGKQWIANTLSLKAMGISASKAAKQYWELAAAEAAAAAAGKKNNLGLDDDFIDISDEIVASSTSMDASAAGAAAISASTLAIIIAIVGAIAAAAIAWDNLTTTVDEARSKLEETESKIADIQSEIDEINSLESKTEGQEKRLKLLKQELSLQERIKEARERVLKEEQFGNEFPDKFDNDNYNTKIRNELGYIDPDSFGWGDFFSGWWNMGYDMFHHTIEDAEKDLNKLSRKYKDAIAEGLSFDEIDNIRNKYINAIHDTELKVLELQEMIMQMEANGVDKNSDSYQYAIEKLTTLQSILKQDKKDAGIYNFFDSDEFYDAINHDTDALKELINTEDSDVEVIDRLKAAYPDLLDLMDKEGISVDTLINKYLEFSDARAAAAEQVDKGYSKSEMIDAISNMTTGFDKLDEIYADIYDKGSFDFTKLASKGFTEAFEGLEKEYTEFIETVSAHPDDLAASQEAFNKLVGAYISSEKVLQGLNEENKDLTINMLKNMGVANAKEVVEEALADKELQREFAERLLAKTSHDVTEATSDEINALIKEGNYADDAKVKIYNYALQKKFAAGVNIRNNDDINFLIELAEYAELAGDVVYETFQKIRSSYNTAKAFNDKNPNGLTTKDNINVSYGLKTYEDAYTKATEDLWDKVKSKYATLAAPEVDYSGGDKTKDAIDKANKSAEESKEIIDWIEKALQRQEEQINRIDKTVNATYKNWSTRNSSLLSEINEINKEIGMQTQAYQAYLRDAEAVPLAENYKKLVREGAMHAETITDKTLKKNIDHYTEL